MRAWLWLFNWIGFVVIVTGAFFVWDWWNRD